MKKQLKTLVIQFRIPSNDIDKNIKRLDRLIASYKKLQPDLVIIPEYGLTGIGPGLLINNNQLKKLSEIAEKYSIYLIPGSFIRKGKGGKYNQSCLIDNKGKILGFASKQCLWSSEKAHLKKGNNKVFKTPIGKIGISICADLFSTKISAEFKKAKPDLIVNVSLWAKNDSGYCKKIIPDNLELTQTTVLAQARALENQCHFIFCNYASETTYTCKTGRKYVRSSIGNSMIINPFGEIIAKTNTSKEQVLFNILDLKRNHWGQLGYE